MLYDKELPLQIDDTQNYVAGQRTSSEMSYSFIVFYLLYLLKKDSEVLNL